MCTVQKFCVAINFTKIVIYCRPPLSYKALKNFALYSIWKFFSKIANYQKVNFSLLGKSKKLVFMHLKSIILLTEPLDVFLLANTCTSGAGTCETAIFWA